MFNIGDKFHIPMIWMNREMHKGDYPTAVGKVIELYDYFALLDFGWFKECIPYWGEYSLSTAGRAK